MWPFRRSKSIAPSRVEQQAPKEDALLLFNNSLGVVLDGFHVNAEERFSCARTELQAIFERIQSMDATGDFKADVFDFREHVLLIRCARWCLRNLGTEFETLIGIEAAEGEAVLRQVFSEEALENA
jgi:hypothetical protein